MKYLWAVIFLCALETKANLTDHLLKCRVFNYLGSMIENNPDLNASESLKLCLSVNGDIQKLCQISSNTLCKSNHDMDNFSNLNDKLYKHHLASLFLNMDSDFQKKRISNFNVLSNNQNIEECLKQYEHNIITKVGENYLTLVHQFLKPEQPLLDTQITKLQQSLHRTFDYALDEQKRCLKNAKADQNIAVNFTCQNHNYLFMHAKSLSSYCEKGLKVKSAIKLNNDQILNCQEGLSTIALFDHLKTQNFKIKKLKRANVFCKETGEFNQACKISKMNMCSNAGLIEAIDQIAKTKKFEEAYLLFVNKFSDEKFNVSTSHQFYRQESKIKDAFEQIGKQTYINNAELCAQKMLEATDYWIDFKLNTYLKEKIIELAQALNQGQDSQVLSKFMNDFDFGHHQILKQITENVTTCQKQSRESVDFFNKKMCSRYKVFLKKIKDPELKKICR